MSVAAIMNNSLLHIKDTGRQPEGSIADIYIGNLCTSLGTVTPDTKISIVSQMIRSDPYLPGFCVIQDNMLLGVATKNQMNAKLSSQYGYNLYCNKGIEVIMCKDFLCVDFFTSIDIVVKIAMQRDPDKIYDFITITKDGRYSGIVTVKDLLEKSIKIEIVNAAYGNQAPSLAGRTVTAQLPQPTTNSSDRSCVLDFDIDNFKSYNDVYGFDKGDAVMKCLSQILSRNIPKEYFVGQDGEQDFIAVAAPSDADTICRRVIEEFYRMSPEFYFESDWNRGYIVSKNRHGIEEIYPLMSITVAGVSSTESKNISEPENLFESTSYSGISEPACKIKSICI